MKPNTHAWISAASLTLTFLGATAAKATTVDLTTAGALGTLHGAIFEQPAGRPDGPSDLRLSLKLRPQARAGADATRRIPSIPLRDIGTVAVGRVSYRRFSLDIDARNVPGQSRLTLADLKIYLAGRPDAASLDTLGAPVYDLNSRNGGNAVLLDTLLERGIGKKDCVVLIPNAAFANRSGTHVYVVSRFTSPQGGLETAAFGEPKAPARVPEPSSIIITLLGLGCLGGLHLRRSIRSRMDAEGLLSATAQ